MKQAECPDPNADVCGYQSRKQGADPSAPWWALAGIVLLILSASGWRAGWRAAACRYAGLAAMTDRAGPAQPPRIRVSVPGHGRVLACVTAYWRLGDVATALRLSGTGRLAPGLLLVPATACRALQRALQRHAHARR